MPQRVDDIKRTYLDENYNLFLKKRRKRNITVLIVVEIIILVLFTLLTVLWKT